MPNRGSPGNARGEIRIHRRIIVVSDPCRDENGRRIADRPVVAFIVAGTGFDGDGFSGDDEGGYHRDR